MGKFTIEYYRKLRFSRITNDSREINTINQTQNEVEMKKTNWFKLLIELARVIIAFMAGAGGASL